MNVNAATRRQQSSDNSDKSTWIQKVKPLLTSAWAFKKTWENGPSKGSGIRKCSRRIALDWRLLESVLRKYNGKNSIILHEWPCVGKEGFSEDEIEPAADASGNGGWGCVCAFGYAYSTWSGQELKLPIHLKEGLALYMLIAIFGGRYHDVASWRESGGD